MTFQRPALNNILTLPWLLATLCWLPGCGGGDTATVTGMVTFQGQPLKEGAIGFIPEKGRPAYGKIVDGHILEVIQSSGGPGAPLGLCKVHINPAPNTDMYAKVKPVLPARYSDPEKSGLTADIKPGDNVLKFDLHEK